MDHLLDPLVSLPAVAAYTLVGLLALGESLLLIGFVLPGELAVILGGVMAARGQVSLPAMLAVTVLGAVLGQALSFEVARRFGPRLRSRLRSGRSRRAVGAVEALIAKHGVSTLIVGRFVGYLRPALPAAAGLAGMDRRRFHIANVAGGAAWAGSFTLGGYVAGDAYQHLAKVSGWAAAGTLAAAGVGAIWYWRRKRPTSGPQAQNRYGVVTATGAGRDRG